MRFVTTPVFSTSRNARRKNRMYKPLLDAFRERPEIATTLVRHAQSIGTSGTVPRRVKELCALMVSWLNACEYCTSCHADLAERLGIDQSTLDDLGNYARSDHFSAAERAALAAAVALTREPRALPENLRADLLAHFNAGEFTEIIATIGFYNYVSRVSNALQLATVLG